ncbi:hypothetical protein P5G50_12415 [Leifsonia sp. F6_8S_P_1B]|uniref:Uncharacterized protein n=1 Tax=Leifsonia williamsii TaxID=3035919 RepID=A0ABT8KDJ4_9MICO|nr:hypothetical protein [Leifsonia williamsii]MDN4615252.1 hypothetical protein [Leifsonia williamsii]
MSAEAAGTGAAVVGGAPAGAVPAGAEAAGGAAAGGAVAPSLTLLPLGDASAAACEGDSCALPQP